MQFPSEIVWMLVGIVLILLEFFIPGVVIVFFGAGALTVALTTWLHLTPTLSLQLLVFSATSILYLITLRRLLRRVFTGKESVSAVEVNFVIEIGKVVPVTEFIQPGEVGGKVRYMGTLWTARAEEPIAPGESVRIRGYDNLTLIVEKIKKGE